MEEELINKININYLTRVFLNIISNNISSVYRVYVYCVYFLYASHFKIFRILFCKNVYRENDPLNVCLFYSMNI